MGKRRSRYTVTGNLCANGVSLKGNIFVYLGPCGFAGLTKTKDGKKLPKSDLTYRKFRFEDPKIFKELGLNKGLMEYHFTKEQVKTFLTLLDEENT